MIKVNTLTKKEIDIDIEPIDTIERIKKRVSEGKRRDSSSIAKAYLCW